MYNFQAGSDAAKRISLLETHPAYAVEHLPNIICRIDFKVVRFGHHLALGSGR